MCNDCGKPPTIPGTKLTWAGDAPQVCYGNTVKYVCDCQGKYSTNKSAGRNKKGEAWGKKEDLTPKSEKPKEKVLGEEDKVLDPDEGEVSPSEEDLVLGEELIEEEEEEDLGGGESHCIKKTKKWTPLEFPCRPITCALPEDPPFAGITVSKYIAPHDDLQTPDVKEKFCPGSVINFNCAECYTGGGEATCHDDTSWSEVPECVPIPGCKLGEGLHFFILSLNFPVVCLTRAMHIKLKFYH